MKKQSNTSKQSKYSSNEGSQGSHRGGRISHRNNGRQQDQYQEYDQYDQQLYSGQQEFYENADDDLPQYIKQQKSRNTNTLGNYQSHKNFQTFQGDDQNDNFGQPFIQYNSYNSNNGQFLYQDKKSNSDKKLKKLPNSKASQKAKIIQKIGGSKKALYGTFEHSQERQNTWQKISTERDQQSGSLSPNRRSSSKDKKLTKKTNQYPKQVKTGLNQKFKQVSQQQAQHFDQFSQQTQQNYIYQSQAHPPTRARNDQSYQSLNNSFQSTQMHQPSQIDMDNQQYYYNQQNYQNDSFNQYQNDQNYITQIPVQNLQLQQQSSYQSQKSAQNHHHNRYQRDNYQHQQNIQNEPQQQQNFHNNRGGESQRGNWNNSQNQNQAEFKQHQAYFDLYSKNFDSLYREPKDGMISLRRNAEQHPHDKNLSYPGEVVLPTVELVTLIDLSTLWEDKQKLAGQIALRLCTLHHPNLLNMTRTLKYLDNNQMKNGFLQFCSEAPDHISSWKAFCKRPFTLSQTISAFRQLCQGLAHIHQHGMIFRDVHPTRIHLKDGDIKLNLVGMPYNFKKLLKNESFSGHLNYSAPEILESGPENFLTPKVDVWSLGCCLYYLATKRDPFDGSNPGEIKMNIRKGKIDKDLRDPSIKRHPIINQLLNYSLAVDLNLRPSAQQLIQIIDDLVLQNIGILNQDAAMHQGQIQPNSDLLSQNQRNKKNIPEFFVKKNLNDGIYIKNLPFQSILEKSKQNSLSQTMISSPSIKVVKYLDNNIEQMSYSVQKGQQIADQQPAMPVIIPGFKNLVITQKQSVTSDTPNFNQGTPVADDEEITDVPTLEQQKITTDFNYAERQMQEIKMKLKQPDSPISSIFQNSNLVFKVAKNTLTQNSQHPSSSSQQSEILINEQNRDTYLHIECQESLELARQLSNKHGKEQEKQDQSIQNSSPYQSQPQSASPLGHEKDSIKRVSDLIIDKDLEVDGDDYFRMQSAPMNSQDLINIVNLIQTPGLPPKKMKRESSKNKKNYMQSPDRHRGSQMSQKSWSSNKSGLSKRIQRLYNENAQSPADIHNLQDKSGSQGSSGSDETNKKQIVQQKAKLLNKNQNILRGVWNQNQQLFHHDSTDLKNSSSLGSNGTMAQEMIDLVDNLIDSSPSQRADLYEKSSLSSSFALRINKAQSSKLKSEEQSQVDVVSEMDCSVGILKYGSGDVYEGQLLNGKRSGRGKMTFANGDRYIGMWKSDQMCDPEGNFYFKNGNEYIGQFKTCSRIVHTQNKYGCFEGPGKLKVAQAGTFEGNFSNNLINGFGCFKYFNSQKVLERNWSNCRIEDFLKEIIDQK